jgi:molybdopterin-guanine dinucleotide biosynthesis protein A
MDAISRLPLYVLAGGRSRRFGRDKAEALIDGVPLLRHVARALDPVASEVVVVADRAGKYDHLGFPTIADLEPGMGPLAGLVTALTHRLSGWSLLAPCDVVGLDAEWFASLARDAIQGPYDAVAFRGSEWEPLPALYHTRSLAEARVLLQSPNRSLRHLLDRVKTLRAPLPETWHTARRITTPSDLG